MEFDPVDDLVISVKNMGKQYRIGARSEQSDRLGDFLIDLVRAPLRRARSLAGGNISGASELTETFWALQDITFDIRRGEVTAIVGRNGAGKSTLLKLLSRITQPTVGEATVVGRLGALLEVGTGFHPDLSGRENVFLNGAILGMKRAEIAGKFDDIVAFAELEQFIDTPVKHYSSGMYVRLAFSVAAHLETEVLLVDEVLAVGDLAFQQKCLGRIDEVSREGRTVLFVSHNMSIVQSLCRRGILLEGGRIVEDGPIDQVVTRYIQQLRSHQTVSLRERTDRRGRGRVQLQRIRLLNESGAETGVLRAGERTEIWFELNELMRGVSCVATIYDQLGRKVSNLKSDVPGELDTVEPTIGAAFGCVIDELTLMPGRYYVNVLIRGGGEWQDFVEAALFFDVHTGWVRGRPIAGEENVSTYLPHRWTLPRIV